jgi:hypothetical protein
VVFITPQKKRLKNIERFEFFLNFKNISKKKTPKGYKIHQPGACKRDFVKGTCKRDFVKKKNERDLCIFMDDDRR